MHTQNTSVEKKGGLLQLLELEIFRTVQVNFNDLQRLAAARTILVNLTEDPFHRVVVEAEADDQSCHSTS